MATLGARFKTGQVCDTAGIYIFDGYMDGIARPGPTAAERSFTLALGHTFPPVHSQNAGAWWKLQRLT